MPEGSKSKNTLFVRNLPYDTSDAELEKLFGHYGQITSCFTVKENGVLDRCRGFGYVTYSLWEDAEKAKGAVKVVGGRPVLLTYADRKPSKKVKRQQELQEKEGNKKGHSTNLKEKSVVESEDSDSEDYEELTSKLKTGKGQAKKPRKKKAERAEPSFEVGRVVVVTGLSEQASEEQIRDHCSPYGAVGRLDYPVPGRDVPTAFVVYKLHKEARVAVQKIDKSSLGGDVVRAVLLSKEGKTPSKKSLQKSRLIVRNLSFKCSEEDVRKVFSPFGEVMEVRIPKKPGGLKLGYAFVQLKSYLEASKAIAAVNESKIKGRPVAVDWAVPRDKYKILSSENASKASSSKKVSSGEGDADEEEEEQEGEDVGSDSDLERDKDTESSSDGVESVSSDGEGASSDGEDVSSDGEDASSDGEDVSSDGEDASSDGEGESEDSGVSDSSDQSDQEDQPKKILKEDAKDGKTLFIRNVPCDVDEDELRKVFVEFGPVRYCRAVLDPVSGSCRGSAFVQFRNAFSVQPCLEASTSDEKGLRFDGSRLDVTLALSQKELQKLGEKRAKNAAEKERDKRNLYLAREGVIAPNSEAAASLTKTELAKRAESYSTRKTKLRNPYFFVSKTRLSVRELPLTVSEKELKRVFLGKAGTGAKIKQVKLMRSKERFTSDGLGRSMGYGFVEFAEHSSALAALRAVNNNPEIFGPKKRPIVEFALEDSRVLKRREQKKQKQNLLGGKSSALVDSLMEQKDNAVDKMSEGDSGRKLSKRVDWQLKWKERRLKQKGGQKTPEKKEARKPRQIDKDTNIPRRTVAHSTSSKDRHGSKRQHANEARKPRQSDKKDARIPRRTVARSTFSKDRRGSKRQHADQKNREKKVGQQQRKRKSGPLDVEPGRKPRKRRKAEAEVNRKEKEFAAMVKNYKAKLFSRNEDTRWFQ